MSGGSGGGSQTTIQELNAVEREPIRQLYDRALNQYNQGPNQYYPNITVAPPTDTQINAEADALRYASGLGTDIMNVGGDALTRGLRSPYEVFNDPGLKASFGTAVRPIEEMLQRNLFDITSASNKTGNLGGTRQGVIESLAFNQARDSATDAFNKLYGGAYGDMVKTQGVNLANLGTIQAGLGYGDSLRSQIGGIEQQRVQDRINENIARYQFGQDAPYANLVNLANIVNTSRLPTSATTYGDNMQQGGGRLANTATGAATGASIGSYFGQPAIGAGIGAGIGLLV